MILCAKEKLQLGYNYVTRVQLKFYPILFVFLLKFANYISRLVWCNKHIQCFSITIWEEIIT